VFAGCIVHFRCLICELPSLVVANQMLWSAHPANPLKATAHFHLGKRKPAEARIHEAWQLFQQRCASHQHRGSAGSAV
jgi:hypothetical protein